MTDTVYPDSGTQFVVPPTIDAPEDYEIGLLPDGRTTVAVLDSCDRCYTRPTMGYAPGPWEHDLVFDGRDFLIASTHLFHGDTRLKTVPEHLVSSWRTQVPRSSTVKGRRRPPGATSKAA